MADYLDLAAIMTAIGNGLKDPQQVSQDLYKAVANMIYFDMLSCDELWPMHWLVDFDDSKASVAPGTITGITQANPGVFTVSSAHGLEEGDIVTIHSVSGMTEVNDHVYYVSTTPATTTFTLVDVQWNVLDTSGFTAYSSGGVVNHRGVTLDISGKSVQRILYASWNDENIMTPISPKEIEENNYYHWTPDTAGPPDRYYHGKTYFVDGTEFNQIFWHPGAQGAEILRYWFEQRPSPLTEGDHVPLMPPEFHYGIVAGSIAMLAENEVQVNTQVVWPKMYQEIRQRMIDFNGRYWKEQEKVQQLKPHML